MIPKLFIGVWLGLVALAALSVATQVANAQTPDASPAVRRFQDALIHVMQNGAELGFAGRRDYLMPVVSEGFDLLAVSRLVLGKRWKQLDANQQTEMTALLQRLAATTLASQFTSYAGERFEILSEKPLQSARRYVRSEFHTSDSVLRVDFALHHRDAGWRIINVWYDGVSGSRIHREEFAAIISRDGVEGLMQRLNEQIAQLAGG